VAAHEQNGNTDHAKIIQNIYQAKEMKKLSAGTPFTVPPLLEDLDFDGATSSAEMILDGTYNSSGLADITWLVISNLRTSKYVIHPPLTTTISDVAYISKIKNWKESTSMSPSDMHLGHYHAMVARHKYSGLKDIPWRRRTWIQNSQPSDLHTLHSQIMHLHMDIPLSNGAQLSML
jgi:hypothetical protein